MCLVVAVLLAFQAWAASARKCVAPYEVLVQGASQCSCLPGFSGPACLQCGTTKACDAVTKGTKCVTSFQYTPATTTKAYECTFSKTLQMLFPDGSMGLVCNTETTSCTMSVYRGMTGYQGPHAVDCKLNECSFSGTKISCKSLNCKCTDICSNLAKTIFEVNMLNKYVYT
jgi:hypothetical protein